VRSMGEFEQVTVKLQSGVEVSVNAWPGSDTARPIVMIGPSTVADDWNEFAARLSGSHSPVLAGVSSSYELLMLIWEIGEPVLLLSQGSVAATLISKVVDIAPGGVTAIAICDGEVPTRIIDSMHSVPALILRGRQGKLLSHESAVALHDALPHSKLIELENCGDFPARDNPDAAAAAVNLFLIESGSSVNSYTDSEPIDPRP